MITFWTKSLLSLPLAVMALINLFTMLELIGRPDKRFDPKKLRLIHRLVGLTAVLWMLMISGFCVVILRASEQALSPRSALHMATAVVLLVLLAVKILLVRFYRKLFSYVPPLGIAVFTLLLTTLALSAGSYLLTATRAVPVAASTQTEVALGQQLFRANCADCHDDQSERTKIGPGLKGLASRGTLPVSGRPVTAENIRRQLQQPVRNMPSFADLPDAEKDALARYLLSL